MNKSYNEKRGCVTSAATQVSFICAICFATAYYFQPFIFLPNSDNERHKQLKWFIPVVAYLVWKIFDITAFRADNKDCIDGSAFTKVEPVQLTVMRSILQNTLEQTVILTITHLVWIVVMPSSFLALQPVGVILFLLGRLSFESGYHRSTEGRAFGFSLTFLPTVMMCVMEGIWFVCHLFNVV
jgi:uncharacterized membrane protein YecN with MAPEG domain